MKKSIQLIALLSLPILFQSCSWNHLFLIKNDTQQMWNISYTTNHEEGVFKNKIIILNPKKDTANILTFPDGKVHFSIQPKQTAIIGEKRNTPL